MKPELQAVLTPIFDDEMGQRLRIARMKMRLDQKALGKLLGISQQNLSNIEAGKIRTSGFNLARFIAIMGDSSSYVLIGANAAKFDEAHIVKTYWNLKNHRPKKNQINE